MKKIGIITSPGGHLVTLLSIEPLIKHNDAFWVTLKSIDTEDILEDKKKYFVYGPESRNILNLLRNVLKAFNILFKEKPDILISSGAGIAIPFFIIGKLFFSTKLIFIEVFDFVQYPSLTGKMLYLISDHFIVQHSKQLTWYPKATYLGKIV